MVDPRCTGERVGGPMGEGAVVRVVDSVISRVFICWLLIFVK